MFQNQQTLFLRAAAKLLKIDQRWLPPLIFHCYSMYHDIDICDKEGLYFQTFEMSLTKIETDLLLKFYANKRAFEI